MSNKEILTSREILNKIKEYQDTDNKYYLRTKSILDYDANQPVPVDGDSIYEKDIDVNMSNSYNFDNCVTCLFNDLHSTIIDDTTTNPKQMFIHFKRTFLINGLGLGSNDGGTFSNLVVKTFLSGGEFLTVYDNRNDNTKRTTETARFTVNLNGGRQSLFPANGILIEFHTPDTVELTNAYIPKLTSNISILQGQKDDGTYVDFQASRNGNIKVALDEYQGDAFGRLRIAEPYTLFDNSLTNTMADSLFWSNKLNGTASGIYDRGTSKYNMSVSSIGDYLIRQTKERFNYQPGKALEILLTGLIHNETGIRKRCGYGDYDNYDLPAITNTIQNGVYIENDGNNISFNISNNGVITESVNQEDWNVDKCDGTGSSGFALDINSTNIFYFDMEWLGVGAVRCGFVNSTGEIVIAHQFKHASNNFTDVYMRTANLSPIYEITAIADNAGSMKQICTTVVSNGGHNPIGNFRSVFNSTQTLINKDIQKTIIGIRLKADYFEYTTIVDKINILNISGGSARWFLCLNPALVGIPTWVDLVDSSIQYSEDGVEVSDLGVVISSGLFSNDVSQESTKIPSAIRIAKDLNGNLDEMWVVIYGLNQQDSYYATLDFRELI